MITGIEFIHADSKCPKMYEKQVVPDFSVGTTDEQGIFEFNFRCPACKKLISIIRIAV